MKKSDRNALLAFPVLILIGFLVAVAGSEGGGIPVFVLCVTKTPSFGPSRGQVGGIKILPRLDLPI